MYEEMRNQIEQKPTYKSSLDNTSVHQNKDPKICKQMAQKLQNSTQQNKYHGNNHNLNQESATVV